MATRIYFKASSPASSTVFSNGEAWVNCAGTSVTFGTILQATGSAGTSVGTITTSTEGGPTSGVEVDGKTSPRIWYTGPLESDVTVSGSITFNLWAAESSMSANVAINCRVLRYNSQTGAITEVIRTTRTTEVAVTTRDVHNWTATPTSTTFHKGDRIMLSVFADDAGTMGSGYTWDFGYDGTVAQLGESWVEFTETFSHSLATGTGSYLYLTDTAVTADSDQVLPSSFRYYTDKLGISSQVQDIHYANGYWVGVSSGGLWTASDPSGTWTQQLTGINLVSVVYANGYWVAVGGSGNLYYRNNTSPAGTWTSNSPQGSNGFFAVAYGNGYWVAVGANNTLYYRATDPTGAFTSNPPSGAGATDIHEGVGYLNGYWVVAGSCSGTNGQLYYRATDPTGSWTSKTVGITNFTRLRTLDGTFVVIRSNSDGVFYYATDPSGTWTSSDAGTGAWEDVAYIGGYWLVAASNSTGAYATSISGSWTATDVSTGTLVNCISQVALGEASPPSMFVIGEGSGDITISEALYREMWTSRGAGSVSGTFSTVSGPTSGVSVRVSGAFVEWYSKPLTAFTLSGVVECALNGLESNALANATWVADLGICDTDGSNYVAWSRSGSRYEIGTSAATLSFGLAGDDVSITDGQRLRLRVYADDAYWSGGGQMASGYTVTFSYAGSSGGAGDSYLRLVQTVSEYVSTPPRVPYRSHMPQLLAH